MTDLLLGCAVALLVVIGGMLSQHLVFTEQIKRNTGEIKVTVAELTTVVENNTTVIESALALIQNLAAEIVANKTDPVALQALADSLNAEDKKLADAVAANTVP